MQNLFNYISEKIPLDSKSKNFLSSISKEIFLKKNTILIEPNKNIDKTYFVINGCVRSFFYDIHGREHTLQFAINNFWISDYIALYNKELTTLTIETIHDTKLIEFNISDVHKVCDNFPEFAKMQRNLLEKHVANLGKRIINLLQLSAEERYDVFKKNHPELATYLFDYHIASYLGITQQSLSRIRSNLKTN